MSQEDDRKACLTIQRWANLEAPLIVRDHGFDFDPDAMSYSPNLIGFCDRALELLSTAVDTKFADIYSKPSVMAGKALPAAIVDSVLHLGFYHDRATMAPLLGYWENGSFYKEQRRDGTGHRYTARVFNDLAFCYGVKRPYDNCRLIIHVMHSATLLIDRPVKDKAA